VTSTRLDKLAAELAERRAASLYRSRLVLDSPQGTRVRVGGAELLSFCSNDYLGLANHPRVIAAFKLAADRYGVGAGASHLVSGHSAAHHALEEELAALVGAPRALLFSTGYMANLGVVVALTERHDTIFEDRLNHASLIDAARLARARVKRYAHGDVAQLGRLLAETTGDKLIVTDAVFSMDGDIAPLREILQLAQDHDAWLLADDAHGLGVLGNDGRGSFAHLGLAVQPPAILMGTLGKAFGGFGAFVAADEVIIETLIQQARTYIYTTALPPAVAEAVRAALRVAQDEPWRCERLRVLIARFRRGAEQIGLALAASHTPIQPLILGESNAALAASQALRARGMLVPAIRPPTVPQGAARLRITLSAAHDETEVDRLLDGLAALPSSATP
jgi:8-amino-7-oxononanoate synthase